MTAYIFTLIVSLIFPIAAGLYFALWKKPLFKPFILGVLTFTVSQVLVRIPLLEYVLPRAGWYWTMSNIYPVLYTLFLGISAALFENIGRYLTMSLFLKNDLQYDKGIAFGLGHGGIEALLLVGINTFAALLTYGPVLAQPEIFLSGAERIFAVIFHIAASLLVMKSVKTKKIIYLAAAIALHAAMDSGILLLAINGLSTLVIEIILAVFTVFMIILAICMKKSFDGGIE